MKTQLTQIRLHTAISWPQSYACAAMNGSAYLCPISARRSLDRFDIHGLRKNGETMI